jgi:hypothetical protein
MPSPEQRMAINALMMVYGSFVIQRDLTFSIQPRKSSLVWAGADVARARCSAISLGSCHRRQARCCTMASTCGWLLLKTLSA